MGEKSYGQLLMEGFVRAIPWAIILSAAFLVTMSIVLGMLRQEVKKSIQYAESEAIWTALEILTSKDVLPLIKQNTKEAIEYTINKMDGRLVAPYVKKLEAKK